MVRDDVGRVSDGPIDTNLRNLLRGRASGEKTQALLVEAFDGFRLQATPAQIDSLFDWMRLVPDIRQTALRAQRVQSHRDLHSVPVYQEIDLAHELQWAALQLQLSERPLQRFTQMRAAFSTAYASNSFVNALEILDSIDLQIGKSLWSIENRIALTENLHGTDAHRRLAREMQKKAPRSFASFFAYHVSRRNEDSVLLTSYIARFRSLLRKWQLATDLSTYMSFKLLDEIPPNDRGIAAILRHEETTSSIDLFETIIRLSPHILSLGTREQNLACVDALDALEPTGDYRIRKLQYLGGGAFPNELPLAEQQAADAFWRGDLASAVTSSLSGFSRSPNDVTQLIVGAFARAEDGRSDPSAATTLVERAMDLAGRVIAGDDNFERALSALGKLSINNRAISALSGLYSCARLHLPIADALQASLERIVFACGGTLDPGLACFLPREMQFAFLDEPAVRGHASIVGLSAGDVRAGRAVNLSGNAFTAEHRLELEARGAILSERFDDALRCARSLEESSLRYHQLRGSLLVLDTLIADQELGASLEKIASLAAGAPLLRALLPAGKIFANKTLKDFRQHLPKISLPIACEINYAQSGLDDHKSYLRWSCDEFLASVGLLRPSDAAKTLGRFDLPQLVYFLENVCSPPVLQACRALESSRLAEEERLNVCSALAALAPNNGERYREEITALEARLLVEDGVRLVERSRIFVDLEEIAKVARKQMQATYEIFRSKKSEQSEDAKKQFKAFIDEAISGGKPPSGQYLELPKEDYDSLLVELVEGLKREFYSNTEHGLEKFLSMRIRHGTLSGTLRGPLDERKLSTSRERADGPYRLNTFWMDKLAPEIDERGRSLVGQTLAWLSQSYDALVENEVRSQIKVRSDGARDAFLGGPLAPLWFHLLRQEAVLTSDFSTFLDVCFRVFQKQMREELTQLRSHIDAKFRSASGRIFSEAGQRLKGLPNGARVTELRASIAAARTDAFNALGKVCGWLVPEADDLYDRTYSVRQLADVGIASTRRTLRAFSFREEVHVTGDAPLGASVVREVADILFIGLDNVFRHSGLNEPRVTIRLDYDQQMHLLHIDMTSEFAAERAEAVRQGIEEVDAIIKTNRYQDRASSEGRSGLIKLKSLTSKYRSGYCSYGPRGGSIFGVSAGVKTVYLEASGRAEVLHD